MNVVSFSKPASEWLRTIGVDHLLVDPLAASESARRRATSSRDPHALGSSEGPLEISNATGPESVPDVLIVDASTRPEDLSAWMNRPQGGSRRSLPIKPDIIEFRASGFRDVLKEVLALARRVGCGREAMQYIASQERRLTEIRVRVGAPKRKSGDLPCLAYFPPGGVRLAGAEWIDELVRQAGAVPFPIVLQESDREQAPTARTPDPAILTNARPDVLLIGRDDPNVDAVRGFLRHAVGHPDWTSMPAVRHGSIYLVGDFSSLYHPGPAMYRAVELLCRAVYGPLSGIEVSSQELRPIRIRSKAEE